ncbi:sugar ABC transporter substrate-binding protein [bacterium]|nr:sugar ABC transporter substrate-binding protein [bacterium]
MKSMVFRPLFIMLALVLAACQNNPIPQEMPEKSVDYSLTDYEIGVGDRLSVTVWQNPDLSAEVPVRPDGKISTSLVGDILAAGKTPEALAADLTEKLKSFIRNPQVTVIVAQPNSSDYLQRVRVTGAVRDPISAPYRKGMTVLDLVLNAGGLTDFAAANKAKLYRKRAGETKVYPIYLDDILKKGELTTNYDLVPSDVITVPERSF